MSLNKYKKYWIPKKQKSFKEICFPKEFTLQNPQLFLADFMGPNSDKKGILVFHQIGSGKTCTAIRIAEGWKHKRKIYFVVPAALIGNLRNELRSKCAGNNYITEKERTLLKTLHPSSKEYKEIIALTDKRIDEIYNIYSYNKFVTALEEKTINFKNSLVIIDEVQNIVSEGGKYYQVIYEAFKSSPNDMRIVLLSGTPIFDRPLEIALTMNLLKLPKEIPVGINFRNTFLRTNIVFDTEVDGTVRKRVVVKPQNLDKFKKLIKGYVSYFKGAPDYVFPESKIRYIKCEMSDFQYRSYLTVLNREKAQNVGALKAFRESRLEDLPNDFYLGSRIMSNISFPNKDINEDGYDSLNNTNLSMENLMKYSIKFYSIINKIRATSGTVFIYSNFKEYGGIRSLARVLEAHGYSDYLKYGSGRKRFAIMSSETNSRQREEIRDVFNRIDNATGKQIKIILGTPSIKEGISFKNLSQLHILDPYWNYSRLSQVMGRGVRFCSHREMPEEKRFVKIYIYLAVHPLESSTVDQRIMKLALDKKKLIEPFENALREEAVDCNLFYNANVSKDDKPLECSVNSIPV